MRRSDTWKGRREERCGAERERGEWEEDCSTPVRKCDRRPRWCSLHPPPSNHQAAPPTPSQAWSPARLSVPAAGPWSPECLGSAPSSRGWEERRGLRPSSSRASWPPPGRAMARSGVRDAARRAPGCQWCGVSSRPRTPSWTPSPLASMGPVSTERPVCLLRVKWLTACDVIDAGTWTLWSMKRSPEHLNKPLRCPEGGMKPVISWYM